MEESIRQPATALRVATIDIEGILGTPESEQFALPEGHISTYERFADALEELTNGGEVDRLVVNIRSTGGSLADAMNIYEAIRTLNVEVVTRCYGYVASAATVVAQAASRGCREISANALYLIHCCESVVEGNTHSLSATKELLDKSDNNLAEIYALASGRGADHFRQLMNRNNGNGVWLSPEEAVEAGLADVIIAAAPITDDARVQVGSLGLTPLPEPNAKAHPSAWQRLLSFVGLSSGAASRRATDGGESVAVAPSRADAPVAAAPPVAPSQLHTAMPTRVMECDDPSPTGIESLGGNYGAYANDVEGLREALRRGF